MRELEEYIPWSLYPAPQIHDRGGKETQLFPPRELRSSGQEAERWRCKWDISSTIGNLALSLSALWCKICPLPTHTSPLEKEWLACVVSEFRRRTSPEGNRQPWVIFHRCPPPYRGASPMCSEFSSYPAVPAHGRHLPIPGGHSRKLIWETGLDILK